jgi:hypothetical protein
VCLTRFGARRACHEQRTNAIVDGTPIVAQVELVLDRKKVVRHGSSLPTDSSSSNEQVALSNKLESFSLRFL